MQGKHIDNSSGQFLVLTVVAVAMQYLISRQFYWVAGMSASGLFIFFSLLPAILACLLWVLKFRRTAGLLVFVTVGSSLVWQIPQILKLSKIKKDIIKLSDSLNQFAAVHGTAPLDWKEANPFTDNASDSTKHISAYSPKGKDFFIIFTGPDPSVAYTLYSNGKLVFNDD